MNALGFGPWGCLCRWQRVQKQAGERAGPESRFAACGSPLPQRLQGGRAGGNDWRSEGRGARMQTQAGAPCGGSPARLRGASGLRRSAGRRHTCSRLDVLRQLGSLGEQVSVIGVRMTGLVCVAGVVVLDEDVEPAMLGATASIAYRCRIDGSVSGWCVQRFK